MAAQVVGGWAEVAIIATYVIEPAARVDPVVHGVLIDAYIQEGPNTKCRMAKQPVLRLDPRLAPVKASVLPLSRDADVSQGR